MNALKILSGVTAASLIAALTLAALGMITWRLFWIIAILAAFIAYYVIPKLKTQEPS